MAKIDTSIPLIDEATMNYIYYENGVEIEIVFTSIEEGKYSLAITGLDSDDILTTLNNDKGVYRLESKFTIDRDYLITVTITPNDYSTTSEEYHYETIEEWSNNTPNLATDFVMSPINTTSKYETKTINQIVYSTDDYELVKIELVGNDMPNIEIVFANKTFKVYMFNGEEMLELKVGEMTISDTTYQVEISDTSVKLTNDKIEYVIELQDNNVMISYTTLSDTTIKLYYSSLKEITG